jgi:hypothetical protein
MRMHLREQRFRYGGEGRVAELARVGGVTRARMTQIIKLLDLAPDIQERLLFRPALRRRCFLLRRRNSDSVEPEAMARPAMPLRSKPTAHLSTERLRTVGCEAVSEPSRGK